MGLILKLQEGLEKYAGPGHWNDPDMLEVGNPGLTLTKSHSLFSIWCMLAAPLMAGNDLRKMSPEVLKILTNKDAIAIDQDTIIRMQGDGTSHYCDALFGTTFQYLFFFIGVYV